MRCANSASSILHCTCRWQGCWWAGSSKCLRWNRKKKQEWGLPRVCEINGIKKKGGKMVALVLHISCTNTGIPAFSLPAVRTGQKINTKNKANLIPYSDSMGKILPHHKKMVSLALSLPKNVLKLRTKKDFASSTKCSSGRKLNGLYFNFISVSWGANIPLSVSPRIFSHQQSYSFSYGWRARRVPRIKLGCWEKGPQTTECNTSQSVRTANYPPLRCTKNRIWTV